MGNAAIARGMFNLYAMIGHILVQLCRSTIRSASGELCYQCECHKPDGGLVKTRKPF